MSKARQLADLGNQVDDGAITGSNMIINGAMTVAQRAVSATVSDNSNEGYSTVDRWYLNFNNSLGGAVSFSQSTDAPDGFANSLKVQCSTADTSLTTNQYLAVNQRIEAQNLQQLAYGASGAKSMVLSWWMKTETYTGPITIAFKTIDGTSEYFVKSFTPTASWAEYTCVIPPSTSATINNDSGEGLRVRFILAGDTGSSIAAASDSTAWSTTRVDYRNNVGNILSNTSNAFYLTGVCLNVGDSAIDFPHESYGDELARCQRYYQQILKANTAFAIGVNYTNAQVHWVVDLPVEMRVKPSAIIASGSSYYIYYVNSGGRNFDDFNFESTASTNSRVEFYDPSNPTGTAGQAGMVRGINAAAKVELDAEL